MHDPHHAQGRDGDHGVPCADRRRAREDRRAGQRALRRPADAPLRVRRRHHVPPAARSSSCCRRRWPRSPPSWRWPRSSTSRSSPAAAARRCLVAPCRWRTGSCWRWASSTRSSRSTTRTAAPSCNPASPTSPSSKAVEARGVLLRARSLLADRLLDRRQRRREFRRHPLPQVRPHHQQPARPRGRADGRRRHPPRRQAISIQRAVRSRRRAHRLRRPARRRHRGHRCASSRSPQVARGVLLGFPTVEEGCDCVAEIIAEPASSPAAWR